MKSKTPFFAIGLTAFCVAMSLTACNDTATSDSTSAIDKTVTSAHSNIVGYARSEVDMEETANTLQELVDASDFIAEIQVKNISSSVNPDSDCIYTSLTPEIVEIYKGTYQNEFLTLGGGYMNYQEYIASPVFQEEDMITPAIDTSGYTAEELETAEYYYDWCNNYVPAIGDTLLFFGHQGNNGNYYVTYDYQSLFLYEGDAATNQALIVEDNSGWQEPLVTDLLAIVPQAETIPATKEPCDYETILSMPKSDLIEQIQNLTA